jgi:hypothetical protein
MTIHRPARFIDCRFAVGSSQFSHADKAYKYGKACSTADLYGTSGEGRHVPRTRRQFKPLADGGTPPRITLKLTASHRDDFGQDRNRNLLGCDRA